MRAAKVGAGAAICAALAACSAHERGPSVASAPQPGQVVTVDASATPPATGQAQAVAANDKPVVVSAKTVVADRKVARPAGGGLASWYGDRFHGRKTANGERFDMADITAAHRTFPLPSYVRVTNVSNGRSIVVRVNDRGPFHGNRVIDVSRRAADVLGFIGHGVGNVKLDYIGKAPEDVRDSRRLMASYQEFGRPAAPAGMQMAMAPLSDSALAAEASAGNGGAYALASAAVANSAAFVSSSASTVAATAKAAASSATAAVKTILPGGAPAPAVQQPVSVASTAYDRAPVRAAAQTASLSAYAPPQPLIAASEAITNPQATKAKRVVTPTEPALASATPELRTGYSSGASTAPSEPKPVDVSSRIASSFDSFGSFGATRVEMGGSVRAETVR